MTQGTPPENNDNETIALQRSDLPPAAFGQGSQAPTPAQPAPAPPAQPAQQQYGQPPADQYGQAQASYAPPPQAYGQSSQGPSYGAPATPPYHQPAQAGRRLGTAGLVLALVGAVIAAVGLFGVRWTQVGTVSDSLTQPKFLTLRKLIVAAADLDLPNSPTFTIAYFNYAAFVLLGLTLVFAIIASMPTSATPAFRILGVLVGLVSAAAALLVPALDDSSGLSEYLKGGLGLYLVGGGSLVMAVAALVGSKKRT